MENESRTTAKDFFLHLGSMAGLYVVGIAFIRLIFTVINEAYPTIEDSYNYYYYYSSSISLPVATLIIIFPIFLLLTHLVSKTYETEPNKKNLGVRRWLTYITLFVAGVILAGDLVTVLYKFLDGEEFTVAFLLKALAVFVVAVLVFKFYIDEIREKMSDKSRKVWAIGTGLLIAVVIGFGFSVIGSPASQREMKYDADRISDLQEIQWQIINYWQKKTALPKTISDLDDLISGFTVPKDPKTSANYEYRIITPNTFELCAVFGRDSRKSKNPIQTKYYSNGMENENWSHVEGRDCFERTIDKDIYPPIKR